jgi:Flp pilus assembly protein TadB
MVSTKAIIYTGAGLAAGGLLLGGLAIAKRRSKKRNKRAGRSKTVRKKNTHTRKRRKTPHTAGKRKDRSRKRIRYTKNGQPYIILASGKSKFISLKSAKSSHKRQGGKY